MTPGTEDEFSQDEKREVLKNDLNVLKRQQAQQASTLSQFAASEVAENRGRYTTIEKASVVGVSPPNYPKGPDWAVDPVPTEPSLGVDINEMQTCGEAFEVARSVAAQELPSGDLEPGEGDSDGSAAAPSNNPSSLMLQRAGPSAFSKRGR